MTNSISFPAMFDTARNKVGVVEDNISVVNRTRLLFLTEPTSLYNNPNFGVGLKRHLWQYNNENERAIIADQMRNQLRLYEPCVNADETVVTDGLLYSGTSENVIGDNRLEMTVGLKTIYGDNVEVKRNEQGL